MRAVIVMEEDDRGVGIVAADVAPVERAAAGETRKQHRDAAPEQTIADESEAHRFGL